MLSRLIDSSWLITDVCFGSLLTYSLFLTSHSVTSHLGWGEALHNRDGKWFLCILQVTLGRV